MTTKEAGRKGGLTTSKKYGKKHYLKTAAHMNEVLRAKKEQKQSQLDNH